MREDAHAFIQIASVPRISSAHFPRAHARIRKWLSLNATPISSISSDRICGLHIKLSQSEVTGLNVFGVYLPCADMGIECYCEHLVELESLISESQRHGPVMIVGDFNAHLGCLGGVRGHGNPNQQGILLHQLLVRCNLYAVSLSALSQGPQYTFWNSETRTTVDYIIASHDASNYIQHCFTHPPAPLNNSDHLPITVELRVPSATTSHKPPNPKINWEVALKSDGLATYQKLVSSVVTPLLGRAYNNPGEINAEICSVSQQIYTAAQSALPVRSSPKQKKKWYKDQALGHLAQRKKAAWDDWSTNGRPKEGPLYDMKIKSRAEFRRRLKICAANEERRRVQHFDQRFKRRCPNRFKLPSTTSRQGTSLRVDQCVTTDSSTILATWEDHFRNISTSHDEQFPTMSCIKEQVDLLLTASLKNENTLLDVPFCSDEVEGVLKRLKSGKSAGHDMLQSEHLKYGGTALQIWIQQICNAIIDSESVPDCLKVGIVIPIYKGGGKDPLDTNSYRGITLTPVLAKVLESLMLGRLRCHLNERGIPHPNQTAYREKMSCAEAIFSTLEVVSQFSQQNEKMYMCFYDLQKAFDSVQYPVLLKRLYEAGIDGKAWRLIRNWYDNPKCRVRVNGQLSSTFTLERGVLQGSVLSPTLFLLVMDPLLTSLSDTGLGPSISNTYAGAFAHADDIRTVTSSLATLQQQINMVQTFATENALVLNPSKCEVLMVSSSKPTSQAPLCTLGNQALAPRDNVKCLGYWWSWDLSATKAIDEAIKRARRAFFAFGALGAFHGKLNPLSGKTIFDTCVIPILLFGSENWILTDSLLDSLEAFQGEIGRRILKLSKFHSTLATRIALKWPSVSARILIGKLCLLSKVSSGQDSIGCCVFSNLTDSDPQSLRMVQECRSLEAKLDCHGVTDNVVGAVVSVKQVKKQILKADWEACLFAASQHRSTTVAARISTCVSWPKLWDMALDHGERGTAALQALFRTLTRPTFGQNTCPVCKTQQTEISHFEHFVTCHTPITSSEFVIDLLTTESQDVFVYAQHFLRTS